MCDKCVIQFVFISSIHDFDTINHKDVLNKMTDEVNNLIPVGVDDGHFAVKVCAGPDTFYTIESRSYPGKLQISEVSDGNAENLIYETAQGEFVTITANQALAPAVDTRSNDYPTSSPNRALVVHALHCTGLDQPLNIVTGLPVNRFYALGVRNDELIDAKRQSLLRPVKDLQGKQVVSILEHRVVSEAIAAYYDALLNFDGSVNKEFNEIANEEPVAVVDAGGKTLDIATLKEGGGSIYQEFSGTAETGALFLYDRLEAALKERFDVQDSIPFVRLSRAIKTGNYRLYGKQYDVSDLVNAQLDEFAERVNFESNKLLGDASRFGKVLFVGGGANLLRTRLNKVFPGLPKEAITVAPESDDPRVNSVYANARGMYKLAARVSSGKK